MHCHLSKKINNVFKIAKIMIDNRPLVSIVVLTYNSSDYVLETLDSIKCQDYPNLELIVSDDGSNDETYRIVSEWIESNKDSFSRSVIIKSFTNRGTCHNYNQGVCNSSGTFIKTIDGDDCLNGSNCISKFVQFMETTNADICISDVELFTRDDMDLSREREWYDYLFGCVCEDYEDQKKRISIELAIPNPACFFTRKLYDESGGYSEDYKYLEEWPFFFNIIMSGHQIFGLKEQLVKYRLVKKSVSHNRKSKVFLVLQSDLLRFFFHTRLPQLITEKRFGYVASNMYRVLWDYIKAILRYFL